MHEESGPQLFLKYAKKCLRDKLREGLISRDDFILLDLLAGSSEQPEVFLLQKAFPVAVKALGREADEKGKNAWDRETVAEFWHNHRGNGNGCGVRIMQVERIEGETIYVGLPFVIQNIYGLNLKKGDKIYVHRMVAVEKL
jgi:hypothetical protein